MRVEVCHGPKLFTRLRILGSVPVLIDRSPPEPVVSHVYDQSQVVLQMFNGFLVHSILVLHVLVSHYLLFPRVTGALYQSSPIERTT